MQLIDRVLQRAEEVASLLLVAGIAVVVGGQIVFRYFLNSPLSWTEELAQFFLICLTFVAATAVMKRGAHFSIDAFVNLLAPIPRRVMLLVSDAAQLLLVIGLAYYSFNLAQLYKGTSTVILKIPEEAKAYVMIYCFLSMGLHLALRMVRSVRTTG
ncbi:MAG: TRAP transporter small permease [Burkholderiales bacterium]|jgi:TRAP-type C4-dicarboxylate transport system permease small subunit|nr:TRAP transporter small permease [Burkholderiales bacterium]